MSYYIKYRNKYDFKYMNKKKQKKCKILQKFRNKKMNIDRLQTIEIFPKSLSYIHLLVYMIKIIFLIIFFCRSFLSYIYFCWNFYIYFSS